MQGLLSCDELKSIPFLVLGNKIDVPKAASEAELRQALGLHQTTGKVSGLLGSLAALLCVSHLFSPRRLKPPWAITSAPLRCSCAVLSSAQDMEKVSWPIPNSAMQPSLTLMALFCSTQDSVGCLTTCKVFGRALKGIIIHQTQIICCSILLRPLIPLQGFSLLSLSPWQWQRSC